MTHQTKPAASPGTRRALVHNAITKALSDAGDWVPLSVRIAATRAVLAEVDAWHAAEPDAACAHCGSSDHTWDDCEAYTRLVAEDGTAVSAAVAPPTDRAAVLREAISAVRDGDLGPRDGTSRDYEDGWWNSRAAAEQRIRSLVDPSTQTVTVVSHRLPMSEQLAEEMNEGSSLIQQWAARAAAEPTAGARQDGAES